MTTKNQSIFMTGFLLGILFFPACQEKEQPQEIIRPVRYFQVFSTGGTRVRNFSGVAQAGLESRLSFRVPGTVKRIAVKLGDRIRAGQLIAELDSSDYQIRVQQAQAAALQSQAQARNANVNYERVRTLYENKGASAQDLSTARMASESGDAAVQAAEKQLELTQLQLSYTRITAPFNCEVAELSVEINENIQTGQPVFLLTSGSRLEVRVSIPEILISQIKAKDKVTVKFDAITGKEFAATISEVGVTTMGMGTTYPVTLILNQTDPDIRAGMAATAAFSFESQDNRIRFLVPTVAVGEDREGRFVFLAELIPDQEGFAVVRRKPVIVGELTADGIEIFSGLADGDLVVTAGLSHIVEGQKVKL